MKSRRAVSPVIATVILVAVAITITIAVAYWMGGIAGGYTKFEKVEISMITCSPKDTDNIWTITATLKNTGSAAATLNAIYVNQYSVVLASTKANAKPDQCTSDMPTDKTLTPGEKFDVNIYIDGTPITGFPNGTPGNPAAFTSGTMLNIKFHSAGGMDYVKVVELV
ncbi:MAG: archaellin/type IV pilin N-terminal domain-containing protein [Candidatus Bathyarchaeia archaeon]